MPWQQPIEQSLADIRALLALLDHKPNNGDVADIASTEAGSDAHLKRLPVLDHAADLIQERWGQLDLLVKGEQRTVAWVTCLFPLRRRRW